MKHNNALGPAELAQREKARAQPRQELEPIECFLKFTDEAMCCERPLDPAKVKRATDVFKEVSGISNIDVKPFQEDVTRLVEDLAILNTIYLVLPWVIVLFIGIWLMVIFSWLHWSLALYLSVFLFVIAFAFIIAYRFSVQKTLSSQANRIKTNFDNVSNQLNEIIVKAPQAVLAMTCAYTHDCSASDPCWFCKKCL